MQDGSALLRQWKILVALASFEDGITVEKLAHGHDYNLKTIRRDLSLLRRVGFPLVEKIGRRGLKRWRLASRDIPPLALNWEEAMSLALAKRFLDPFAGTPFFETADRALAKLRGSLPPSAIQHLDKMAAAFHVTSQGASRLDGKGELIEQLTIAIEQFRITQLTYQSEGSTEPVTREVHPLAWVFHHHSPYLVANAVERDEIRLYKADRIHDADVWKLQFTPPTDFNVETYLAGSFGIYRGPADPELTIRVRFLPPVVRYLKEKQWHPSQTFTPQRDGSLIAEFRLTATEEIKRWLLSFGPNAEVLEPATLREEITNELKATLVIYEQALVRKKRGRMAIQRENEKLDAPRL